MSIRATRTGIHHQTQRLLERNSMRMQKLQIQAATLKRINRPSDDPNGAARAIGLHADKRIYDRYLGNISVAGSKLNMGTAVIQSISAQITSVRSKILWVNNPDVDTAARTSIGSDMNFILDNMLNEANSQYEGRYIFAGTKVQTQPFVSDAVPGGRTTVVTYTGNESSIWASVGRDARIQTNESGRDVFMRRGPGKDLFTTVARARDIINDPDLSSVERAEALDEVLIDLDNVHSDMLGAMGRMGGRAKTLELRDNLYRDAKLAVQLTLSDVEDADIAEVVYKLQREQAQFELILATSAAILGPTLMDFIR